MQNQLEQQPEPLITAKQAIASKLIPCSTTQLLKLAQMGRVPCHPVPGTGKRVNWWFRLNELYEYFTKNGGKVNGELGGISGQSTLPIKQKKVGSRLQRGWR